MGFQVDGRSSYDSVTEKREHKRSLVDAGRARAAVVFDGDQAVGWCQFGRSAEIAPRGKFKRTYFPSLETVPDWRITCFFTDRKYRGRGVASLALEGALRMIAESGGGLVEAYPERTEGRSVSGAYTPLGAAAMFERRGFQPQRQVAKHHWVMTKTVEASPPVLTERGGLRTD